MLYKNTLSLGCILLINCSSIGCMASGLIPARFMSAKPNVGRSQVADVVKYGGITFHIPKLSNQEYISLAPRPRLSEKFSRLSPVAQSIHSLWDPQRFATPREPVELFDVKHPRKFSKSSNIRVLDMPIKMAGSNQYRLPSELKQFGSLIQQIINHEHAMLNEEQLLQYYAYITVNQSWVEASQTQTTPGIHCDGFQGARINPKTIANHTYLVMDKVATVFYPQAFDFSKLDEKKHNFFDAMAQQANEANTMRLKLLTVYLIDAYAAHRADIAKTSGYRTLARLIYDVKKFDRLGNTHNPHFDYAWPMVPRPIPTFSEEK